MLKVSCSSPNTSPNGPSNFQFSPNMAPANKNSTPLSLSDKVIRFSEKLVSFIHWDITTSDPRLPMQDSPIKLLSERNRKIESLNTEKSTLLQSSKGTPELAACVELLAKKASLPSTSTTSYKKLPPKTQSIVDATADLLLLTKQAQLDTNKALGYDPLRSKGLIISPSACAPRDAFINLCVEKVLLVSINTESLKNQVKTLPQQTQKSLDPILASSTKKSETMTSNLANLINAHM